MHDAALGISGDHLREQQDQRKICQDHLDVSKESQVLQERQFDLTKKQLDLSTSDLSLHDKHLQVATQSLGLQSKQLDLTQGSMEMLQTMAGSLLSLSTDMQHLVRTVDAPGSQSSEPVDVTTVSSTEPSDASPDPTDGADGVAELLIVKGPQPETSLVADHIHRRPAFSRPCTCMAARGAALSFVSLNLVSGHHQGCPFHNTGNEATGLVISIRSRLLELDFSLALWRGLRGSWVASTFRIPRTVPLDSLSFRLVNDMTTAVHFRRGNWRQVIECSLMRLRAAFDAGEASPFDCLTDGFSLLHVS